MYEVIKYFTDLHDNNHPYNVGDEFPRKGISVTAERIAELAGSNNKQNQPLIKLVEEETPATGAENESVEEEAPAKVKAKKTSAKKAASK